MTSKLVLLLFLFCVIASAALKLDRWLRRRQEGRLPDSWRPPSVGPGNDQTPL